MHGRLAPFLATVILLSLPSATAQCALDPITGQQEGTWDGPISIGANDPQWQAHDISSEVPLQYVERILVTVTWTNDPMSSADFGIGIGVGDGFETWNSVHQADLGEQSESILLERADLEQFGWSGGDLRIGPSITTGAAALESIAYAVSWEATLDAAICDDPDALDTYGGTGAAPQSGVPVQWWVALGLAVGAVAGSIAYSTRK